MEEVRDGGLRLVGSTLPTPTIRLDQKPQQKNTGNTGNQQPQDVQNPQVPNSTCVVRQQEISSLLLPKATPWPGCRPVRMAVIIAVTQLNQSAAPPAGAGPREANANKEGNFDIRIVDQRSPRTSISAFRSMAASRSAQIPGPRGKMDWISTEDAITLGMFVIAAILVLASLSAAGATGESSLNRRFKHSLL